MMEFINSLQSKDLEAWRSVWILLIGLVGLIAFGVLLWWLLGFDESSANVKQDNPYGLSEHYDTTPIDADNLTRIEGVDPELSSQLNRAGIYKFEQLEQLNDDQRSALSNDLGISAATIGGGFVVLNPHNDFKSNQSSIEWNSWDKKMSLSEEGYQFYDSKESLNEDQQNPLNKDLGISEETFDDGSVALGSEDSSDKNDQLSEEGYQFDGPELQVNKQGDATQKGYRFEQIESLIDDQRYALNKDFGVAAATTSGDGLWASDSRNDSRETQDSNLSKRDQPSVEAYQFVSSSSHIDDFQVPTHVAIGMRAEQLAHWREEHNIDANQDADWILAERELFIESCGHSVTVDRFAYYSNEPVDKAIDLLDVEECNEFYRLGYPNPSSIVVMESSDKPLVQRWFHHRKLPVDIDQLQLDLLDRVDDWPRIPTEAEIGSRASELSQWRWEHSVNGSELDDWLLAERELFVCACGLSHSPNREGCYQDGVANEAIPDVSGEISDELGRLGFSTIESINTMSRYDKARVIKWFRSRGLCLDLFE